MRMHGLTLIALASLLVENSAAFSKAFQIDTAASSVEFLAVGKPGFLKIKGTGAPISGEVTESKDGFEGLINVAIAEVKTGISMRDEHMHQKYLESQKFPKASLALKKVTFKDKASGECTFSGELTIKAVAKAVEGTCKITGLDTDAVKVSASTEAKIADFPIGVPSHLGISVADTVTITAELTAKKK